MALQLKNYTFKQIIGLVVISALLLMEHIDAHILNVAIPQMMSEFHTNVFTLKLAVTSYLIGISIFIPISGWISDKFGTRNTLIFSTLLFTLMSIECGVADSLPWLIVCRLLQGIAGAFMVPVARLLMLKIFNKDQMVTAYSIMAMPVVLGPILAPVIGGYLVTYYSWRYIFWVNVPLGVLALYATIKYIDNYKEKQLGFSLLNFFFLALFIASASFWLDVLLISDLAGKFKWQLFIIAVISGCLYVLRESGSRFPVIRYRLFQFRTFRISFFSTIIVRAALGGRAFILAIFLEITFKLSALNAGLLLVFMSFGVFASRSITKKLLDRFGFKKMLTYTNTGNVISLLLLGVVTQIDWFLYLVLFLNGAFAAAQFMILNVLYYTEVESVDYGAAVSVATTWQQLGNSIGVIVAAGILHIFDEMLSSGLGLMPFHLTFTFLALISLGCQMLINKLKDDDGQALLEKG